MHKVLGPQCVVTNEVKGEAKVKSKLDSGLAQFRQNDESYSYPKNLPRIPLRGM